MKKEPTSHAATVKKLPARAAQDGGATMKSLRASLKLLDHFLADAHRDLSVGELAALSGLSKATVSKALSAFAQSGILVQDAESRRYSVGPRAYVLGSRFLMQDSLCSMAFPVMHDLVARTGHSARLSTMDGDRVLYMLGLEGPWFVNSGWRAGTWLAPQSTTAGRVMLAFLADKDAKRILAQAIRPLTEHTILDKAKIRQIIANARVTGFTAQRNEANRGLGTVSVPLFGPGRSLLGALSLVFPSHVIAPEQDAALAAELHRSASVISQRSGCAVYPFGQGLPQRMSA